MQNHLNKSISYVISIKKITTKVLLMLLPR